MKRSIFKSMMLVLVLLIVFAAPLIASNGNAIPEMKFEDILGLSVAGIVINAANLAALYKNFKTIFNDAYSAATPMYPDIAMEVPSSAEVEVYAWMGSFPKMREWIGDRVIANLKAMTWSITNKDWEATVSVPRNKILFDTYGVFKPIIQSMGFAARCHPDELVAGLLNDGMTALCYDGKAFFATTHDVGGSNYSNKGTGVFSDTTLTAGLAAIKGVKNDKGQPLGIGSNGKITLVVPPALEYKARLYLFAAQISGTDNVLKGACELQVNPFLNSDVKWYLIAEHNGLKPLVFQNAKTPEFLGPDDPANAEAAKMKKEYIYGVDSIDNAGYGLWQLAYGSTGA